MLKEVIWKAISGYEGYYEASSHGQIRSLDRIIVLKTRDGLQDRPCLYKGRVLKPYEKTYKSKVNTKKRLQIVLSKGSITKSKDVHNLIALTFIPNPNNYDTVNHKDGNPFNNCVDNLEWKTRADNIRHAFINTLVHTQKPVAQIDKETGEVLAIYPGEAEACRRVGVSQGKVGRATRCGYLCKGYKWKYVDINDGSVTTIESWKGFSD